MLADGNSAGHIVDQFNLHAFGPGLAVERAEQSRDRNRCVIWSADRQRHRQQNRADAGGDRINRRLCNDGGAEFQSRRQFGRFADDAIFHHRRAWHIALHEIDRAAKPVIKFRKRLLQPPRDIAERKPRRHRPDDPADQCINENRNGRENNNQPRSARQIQNVVDQNCRQQQPNHRRENQSNAINRAQHFHALANALQRINQYGWRHKIQG